MEKYNNKVNDKFNGLKSKLDAATEQRVHEYEGRSVKTIHTEVSENKGR